MLACVHVTANVRLVSWCAMRRGCSPSGTVRMCSFCGRGTQAVLYGQLDQMQWSTPLGCTARNRLPAIVCFASNLGACLDLVNGTDEQGVGFAQRQAVWEGGSVEAGHV